MAKPTIPPLPTLFALRQFATFANVDLADLAVIADNVRESRFAPGDEIAAADARLRAIHLVLDGKIEVRHGTAIDSWGPREVFGMLEVLADRPVAAPALSVGDTKTLELAAGDTREILEDNFGVLLAMIRGLSSQLVSSGGVAGGSRVVIPSPERLTLVERVIVLRQHAPFVGGRLQALAAVAQSCDEVSWSPGTSIARARHTADAIVIVLDGTLRAKWGDREPQILRAGEAIGAIEALAGIRYGADVETVTAVRAIRCPTAALLDVLEDHTDLGLSMVINFAGLLLDRPRVQGLERDLQPHLS